MGMQNKMESAKQYRLRAQESRTIAEGIFDHEERKKLLQIVDEFDQLALQMDVSAGYQKFASEPPKRPNGADHKTGRNSS
jgi:purine-nucleoside phosphorylase